MSAPSEPLFASTHRRYRRLPHNRFTGQELADALGALATHLVIVAPHMVRVTWQDGAQEDVTVDRLPEINDPQQVITVHVSWNYHPAAPVGSGGSSGGSTAQGRVSGFVVDRRRPWRSGGLTAEHGGWARTGLNRCYEKLAEVHPAQSGWRSFLVGRWPLFLIIILVGLTSAYVLLPTHPTAPPLLSWTTCTVYSVDLAITGIHYAVAWRAVGGTRLVEPGEVLRRRWLTSELVVAITGVVVAVGSAVAAFLALRAGWVCPSAAESGRALAGHGRREHPRERL